MSSLNEAMAKKKNGLTFGRAVANLTTSLWDNLAE